MGPSMTYTSLSSGQIECLQLLVACGDCRQIAERLGVSPGYVEEQLDGACLRLGVDTRLKAAIIASRLGLIEERAAQATNSIA